MDRLHRHYTLLLHTRYLFDYCPSAHASPLAHRSRAMENLDKLTAAGLPVFDMNQEHLDHKDW